MKKFEFWYGFWQGVFGLWDAMPKELKVILYVSLAAAIDQLAKELSPDLLTFVPTYLRVSVLNIVLVFLVEMSKRLKAR